MSGLAFPRPRVGPMPTMGLPTFDETGASRLDVEALVGVILRHWKIALATPIIAGLLAFAVLRMIPPRYVSSVELLVADPTRPTNAVEQGRLSMLGADAPAIDSEIEVLGSHAVAVQVAKALNLQDDPEFIQPSSGLSGFFARLGFGSEAPKGADSAASRLEHAAAELSKHLSIERVRYSYALEISATSTDPHKAQHLATAVAQAYLDYQHSAQRDALSAGKEWLEGMLGQLGARVRDNEAQIQKLKADNGLTDVGTNSNLSQQQTSDVNSQFALARADMAEKRARLEQASQVIKSGGNIQAIPEVMASPVIGQLRAQEADVSRREAELASRFGPAYPDLITARSQLKDIRRGIDAEIGRILDNLKNAYQVALQREQSVEASLQQLTQGHDNASAVVKLSELQRADASDRQLYDGFLSNFNKITAQATLTDSAARIITPAGLPTSPSYPKGKAILALAVVLGGFLGAVLAFLAEYFAPGFTTAAQAEEAFRLPVFGMIFDARSTGVPYASSSDIVAHIAATPASRLSESIRAARIGLKLSRSDADPSLIAVTSFLPKEGKTTSAMLLAASSSLSGSRTLLVDCDLRRKSASHAAGQGNRPGFAEVMEGRISIDEAIVADPTTGLFTMSAGESRTNPADLLNSDSMSIVLRELQQRFDRVILDTPPLLPVRDAAVIADHVDRIVLVVCWNRTPRGLATELPRHLSAACLQKTGILLNRADLKKLSSSGYGYGRGYSYGRSYGQLGNYYQ